jgi:RNA polymerase sigma factor (sigma-70 family)
MQAMDDMALLREYVANNSETAFEELVARRIGFVYSAALRQVRDPHLAGEITQAVFIILAQKAGRISDKTIMTGWLFRTTRFVALAQMRAAVKRSLRTATIEKELQMQTEISAAASDEIWNQMSPLLDEALATLGEKDRQAVLLRFFENKSLAEVGNSLGAGEDTARKRVSRALEKLRKFFSKRDVVSTTATIAEKISANSIQAAPVALAKSVTTVALAKGAAASGSTSTLIKGALKIMAWSKAKTVIVAGTVVLLAAGTATVTVKKLSPPFDPWENADSLSAEFSAVVQAHLEAERNIPKEQLDAELNGRSNAGMERTKKYQKEIDDIFKRYAQKAPAGVFIRPTHFEKGQGGSTMHGHDLMVEKLQPFTKLLTIAYGETDGHEYPLARMVLLQDLPKEEFDFLVNVPDHGLEHFQDQIKQQFGLVGHVETLETNVLALRLKNPAAPGLKPGAETGIVGPCFFDSDNLAKDLEQEFFDRPIVDETKLTDVSHTFLVPFKPVDLESLKKILLDNYGLELVSTNMAVKMLVVEKVR